MLPVKRWAVAGILVLLACLPLWLGRASGPYLLEDSDTRVAIAAIRERADPVSWFRTDWPLENHFYRPVSTLSFEWDLARGGSPGQFGATNALLAILGVLALFWFLRELTDSPWVSAGCAVLFASWLTTSSGWAQVIPLAGVAACLVAAVLPGRRLWPVVAALFTWGFVSSELSPIVSLQARMLDWVPGRTASVMGLFCLAAMACYARYERIGTNRIIQDPGPLDPPATKGTRRATVAGRMHALWAFAAAVGLALALGSYEQAVMLPAALLGVAVCQRLQGMRVRWAWHALYWAVLVGYLALRQSVLPGDASAYQQQQFRDGPGLWLILLDYALPAGGALWVSWGVFDQGWFALLSGQFWGTVGTVGGNIAAFVEARRRWVLPLTGWILSSLAFLPMAWLKQFDHYHYWPMALRTLLVVSMVGVAGHATISALSRPALRAPLRPAPAPGSLPRP